MKDILDMLDICIENMQHAADRFEKCLTIKL